MTEDPARRLPSDARWRLAAAILWAPAAVVTVHVVLDAGLHVYDTRPFLDGPMHLVGGLAVSHGIGIGLAAVRGRLGFVDRALMMTGTATAAVGWELLEFVVDQLLGTNLQVSLANTMKDLAIGTAGGALLAIAGALRAAAGERRRLPV